MINLKQFWSRYDILVYGGIALFILLVSILCIVRYAQAQDAKECQEYGKFINRPTKYFLSIGCVTEK